MYTLCYMVEKCEHKNKRRLYERGKSYRSTPIYKCQDCGELLKKCFGIIKPTIEGEE